MKMTMIAAITAASLSACAPSTPNARRRLLGC
jgi:hypothetical protein